MTPPDLEQLERDYERLWMAYNRLQREPPRCAHVTAWQQQPEIARGDLPECEHVRVWQGQVKAAGDAHRAALRAFDDAAAWTEAGPHSSLSSLPDGPVPGIQGELFPLEHLTPGRAA